MWHSYKGGYVIHPPPQNYSLARISPMKMREKRFEDLEGERGAGGEGRRRTRMRMRMEISEKAEWMSILRYAEVQDSKQGDFSRFD